MPRYFFNIMDGVDLFDDEGVVLSDIREMRLYMLTMALEVMKNEPNQKKIWQMEALDETGKIVGTMDFGLTEELRSRDSSV